MCLDLIRERPLQPITVDAIRVLSHMKNRDMSPHTLTQPNHLYSLVNTHNRYISDKDSMKNPLRAGLFTHSSRHLGETTIVKHTYGSDIFGKERGGT